jgi:ABC-2 type transport system ATP-binding protein
MNDKTDWAIEIEGLVKEYGSIRAVDHISFKIPFGVIFAFLGPNGAGKTTTVEILECLRKPSAGTASVLGLDITKDQNQIRKRIGVLPQEFNTFDRLTVRESLKYYATMYDNPQDIDELISSVDLVDKANTLYKNLSGGLKQRLGVAIALVNDPQVVFLDEPTEGLDPKARRGVWEIITKLRDEGKTVFLTTHYMEEAETLADVVAIILDGKIRALDTTTNLIKNHGGRAKLVIHGGNTGAFEALSVQWAGTELNNSDVIVPLSDKKDLAKIVELLDQRQITFDELEMKKPSLEDVFLDLTATNWEGVS